MKRKRKVKGAKYVMPHGRLRLVAQSAYIRITSEERPRSRDVLTCMLFSALAMEAYLNFLGWKLIYGWERIESGMSPRAKLRLLACTVFDKRKASGVLNASEGPYQVFGWMIDFRNAIVHGKVERIGVDNEQWLGDRDWPDSGESKFWEQEQTPEKAVKYFEALSAIQEELNGAAGLPHAEIWGPGYEEYQIEDVEIGDSGSNEEK